MNSLNSSAWKDLFIPTVSRKHVDLIDEMDEFIRRAETPDLLLKSTGRNRNPMDRSVFNFSYADINQMMPEMPVDAEPLKLIEPAPIVDEQAPAEESAEDDARDEREYASSVSVDARAKKPRMLDKVCEALNCIFTDRQLKADDFGLSDVEGELLKAVVAKKFGADGGKGARAELESAKSGRELLQLVNELRSAFKTKKRKEEKIKFVFKHSLKNLKKAFFQNLGAAHTPENEHTFFEHYFNSPARPSAVPIEHYYDPLNTSNANNPRYKTLSKDYMLLLFTHEPFRRDFTQYLTQSLLHDYQSKVSRKFKKLLKKLRKKIRTASGSKVTDSIREFIVKFDENKRCKLPWTTVEITDAVRCFDEHVESLLKSR